MKGWTASCRLLEGKNRRGEKTSISTPDTLVLLLLTNRMKTATSTTQYRLFMP
jgi:hypothetical protein